MSKLAINGGTPTRTKLFPSWPETGELEVRQVLEVVKSGGWGGVARKKLAEIEEEIAAMHHAKYAVSVVNGTVALTVALKAAGVEAGDEVIMPPYTFIATATATLIFGAIPVFVDIDPDTLLIDPEKIEAAITSKTKAIIAVHIAGASANMTRLKEIAAKHNLRLIEDAAQAIDAEWDGKKVSAIGDLGTLSFQSSKNLSAGEGGMILSNNQEFANKAWSIANVGRIRDGQWYQHEEIGWNFRMTEFQAAILLAQLERFPEQSKRRERNVRLLNQLLSDIEGIELLKLDPRITRHANHLYIFKVTSGLSATIDKNGIIKRINGEGIPVAHGYYSLNQNEAVLREIKKLTGKEKYDSCPVSESLSKNEILWLGQNVLLAEEEDMHDIANAVKKVMETIM